MPATVATLKTYLGLDPASTQDEAAMGAAVAAANDLVATYRPDLVTVAPATVLELPDLALEWSSLWQYATNAAIADPGTRHYRTDASPATQLAISATDDDGNDRHAELLTVTAGKVVAVRSTDTAQTWQLYAVTALVDLGTWVRLSVTAGAAGEIVTAPGNNDRVLFDFGRPGLASTWPARADQAALVEAARLYGRRGSVQGVAAFADIGVSLLPRLDPEFRSLLELGEYQRSVVA